jgi:hypothetical protein
MNVHTQTEGKTDDKYDSIYDELTSVSDKFLKYYMQIFVTRFQCKGKERRCQQLQITVNMEVLRTVG